MFSTIAFHFVLRQELFLNLEFSILARVAIHQEIPKIPSSLPPLCLDYMDYMQTMSCLAFMLGAKDGIQVLMLISTLPTKIFPQVSESFMF